MAYLCCGLSSHTRTSFHGVLMFPGKKDTSGSKDRAAPFYCPWFPQQLRLQGPHQKLNSCPDLSVVSPWATGAWECSRDAVLPRKNTSVNTSKGKKLLGGCGRSKQHRAAVKGHGYSKVRHGLCFMISPEASRFCSRCLLCFHRVDNLSKYFSGLKEQEKRFKVLEAQVSSIF